MSRKQDVLVEELNSLGYYHDFPDEAFPLVNRLFSDLKVTTDNLQKYMHLAQQTIEERDTLQRNMHKARKADQVTQIGPVSQRSGPRVPDKKTMDNKRVDNRRTQGTKVQDVQKGKPVGIVGTKVKAQTQHPLEKNKGRHESLSVIAHGIGEGSSTISLANQRITNLSKELQSIKQQQLKLLEENEKYQEQLNSRDKEINNLKDGTQNVSNETCSCKCEGRNKSTTLNQQYENVTKDKACIKCRLQDALSKQQEAMKRAISLAERNRQLEQELKDIDKLALSVEADCNKSLKSHMDKVNRLQTRIQDLLKEMNTVDQENKALKDEKEQLKSNWDNAIMEKTKLQNVLDSCLEDKKNLSNRINNFTIIENDLNTEIDRLMQEAANQRRLIAELEGQLGDHSGFRDENQLKDTQHHKAKKKIVKKVVPKKINRSIPTTAKSLQSKENDQTPNTEERCESSKHLKQLLDKEMEYRQLQGSQCIESLKSEKDYYMKEYHKLLEQKNTDSGDEHVVIGLKQKLNEKECLITQLQRENKILSQEKYNMTAKLDSVRQEIQSGNYCSKANCKRLERERNLFRADIEKLEEDRDLLMRQSKVNLESQSTEIRNLKKSLVECEEHVQKLERERKELSRGEGTRQHNIDRLENSCKNIKEQLVSTQEELLRQKKSYSQLKTLHEQCDRTLYETRNELYQTEKKFTDAIQELEKYRYTQCDTDKDVDLLKQDIETMKKQLAQMDREKDELLITLDMKTEKVVLLERQLEEKSAQLKSLTNLNTDMKRNVTKALDDNAGQEQLLRNCQLEVTNLRQQLDSMQRIKTSALDENRRLQDDLASVTSDCCIARNELEICRKQIEDLTRQLQEYVSKVKRTEDMITRKEIERNDLLNQFKCLSEEANILETNNSSLENEACQTRVQLSVALDHTTTLEKRIENQNVVIASYEKQVAELTNQITRFEQQLRDHKTRTDYLSLELEKTKDLCLKLDEENERIKRRPLDKNDHEIGISRMTTWAAPSNPIGRDNNNGFSNRASDMEELQVHLSEARRESVDLRALNQELQEEVQRMKVKIQDLQTKLKNMGGTTDSTERVPFLSNMDQPSTSYRPIDNRTDMQSYQTRTKDPICLCESNLPMTFRENCTTEFSSDSILQNVINYTDSGTDIQGNRVDSDRRFYTRRYNRNDKLLCDRCNNYVHDPKI